MVIRDTELCYKTVGGRSLRLLLRRPETEKRTPVYFAITGGGWAQCVKEDILWFTSPAPEDALAAGCAVVSPEYRLYREAELAELVCDCMDAARYLTVHADDLGLDAGRMAFSGHSAGAHLALMTAYAPQEDFCADSPYPGVRFSATCCAAFAAPTILYDTPEGSLFQGGLDKVFGARAGDEAYRRRLSPYTYINAKSPPTYLIHGGSDPVVLYENARRFAARCDAVGSVCRLLPVLGGGHSFEPVPPAQTASPDARAAYATVAPFLRRYLM